MGARRAAVAASCAVALTASLQVLAASGVPAAPAPDTTHAPHLAYTADHGGLAERTLTANASVGTVFPSGDEVGVVEGSERETQASTSAAFLQGRTTSTRYAYLSTLLAGATPTTQPATDVYVRVADVTASGTVVPPTTHPADGTTLAPDQIRVTCDDATESHPVVSPDGTRVAYAAQQADGHWEIKVVTLPMTPTAPRSCLDAKAYVVPHAAGADDLWPSWAGNSSLVLESTRKDPLGDLYLAGVPDAAGTITLPGAQPVDITDDPAAETQPDARPTATGVVVLFTTTQFRKDGSVAMLTYYTHDESGSPYAQPFWNIWDPWATSEQTAPQGDEPSWGIPLDRDPTDSLAAFAFTTPDPDTPAHEDEVAVAWTRTPDPAVPDSPYDDQPDVRGQTAVTSPSVLLGIGGASQPAWGYFVPVTSSAPTDYRLRYTRQEALADVEEAVVADGSGRHVLADTSDSTGRVDDRTPSWSPDGTRVVFTARADAAVAGNHRVGDEVLHLLDTTTGTITQLAVPRAEGDSDTEPAWSPDGRTIAFVRRSSSDGPAGPSQPGHVWLFDVRAGTARDLSQAVLDGRTAADSGLAASGPVRTDDDPVWSPDSTRLAMSSETDLTSGSSEGVVYEARRLVVVDVAAATSQNLTWPILVTGGTAAFLAPAGGAVVQDAVLRTAATVEQAAAIAPPTGQTTLGQLRGTRIAWSPDGTRLAVADVASFASTYPYGGDTETAVANPGGLTVLTLGTPDPYGIPVTRMEAVTGFQLPDPNILAGQVDVATAARATVSAATDPAWSPDGTEIAFSGQAAGQPDQRGIYAIHPDGTGLRLVVSGAGFQAEPAWQPSADLSVQVTATAPIQKAGGTTPVRITVSNAGPAPATPTVTVLLPPGVSVPSLPPGCTGPVAATGGTTVTCTAAQPVPPGGTVTFELPATVEDPGDFPVQVTVTNPGADPDPGNDTATVTLHGTGTAAGNLTVTVTVAAAQAWVGGHPVLARVVVRNAGPGPAQAVTLTTAFPDAVQPRGVSASDTRACVVGPGTCTLGQIAAGGHIEVDVALSPDGPSDVRAARAAALAAGTVPTPSAAASWTGQVTAHVAATSPQSLADDAASATLLVTQPWVRVLPAVARPGDVVLAYAEDLPPGQPATLAWDRGITSQPGPYAVAADGRLSVPVLVVPNDVLGTRTLLLTSAAGAWGPVGAPALVNPPSVDSPDFLLRR